MSIDGKANGMTSGMESSANANGQLGSAMTLEEKKVLDRVGEDLARMGKVKRVGLGVKEKAEYVEVWKANQRR
jgi:hypothetical protein